MTTPLHRQLRAFRYALGLSQLELAELIPVSDRQYRRWETGITKSPSMAAQSQLDALMKRYHFNPRTLSIDESDAVSR